ncbi:MAG TPA: transaldolase family protein, partial [Gaiellaceae bacterium]|nr:transaldolase family protein [Gaiellaceae bacterium]
SIFDKAIAGGGYDDAINEKAATGLDREALFFELAIEDLRRAADMFAGIHERTDGVDGWVSLEVSPLLAYALAAKLQADAATSFVESWNDLLEIIDRQSATLTA